MGEARGRGLAAGRPEDPLPGETGSTLGSFAHIRCLWPLLPLHELELNHIALLQTLVAFRGNGAVVDENIGAVFSANEAIAFGVIEPFHRSLHTATSPQARSLAAGRATN